MAKIAKLVLISLMTRVIVDEETTEEQVIEAARSKFHSIIDSDLNEVVESVEDDEEVPYDEVFDENVDLLH